MTEGSIFEIDFLKLQKNDAGKEGIPVSGVHPTMITTVVILSALCLLVATDGNDLG